MLFYSTCLLPVPYIIGDLCANADEAFTPLIEARGWGEHAWSPLSTAEYAPLLLSTAYTLLNMGLLAFAETTLRVMALRNTFSKFLFPFQFFHYAFYYSFFMPEARRDASRTRAGARAPRRPARRSHPPARFPLFSRHTSTRSPPSSGAPRSLSSS